MPRSPADSDAVAPTRRRSHVIAEPPGGFRYRPDFLDAESEQRLLAHITAMPFEPVVMHGVAARRQVVHYGGRYAYDGGEVSSAAPVPASLSELGARAAAEDRFPAGASLEALVTRYPPGAGIGWHRDAPPFGPVVVGISLGAACEFRLRLDSATGYDVYKTELAPRSLYVLAGTARFRWQHMIPPVPTLRYSITFRTLRISLA